MYFRVLFTYGAASGKKELLGMLDSYSSAHFYNTFINHARRRVPYWLAPCQRAGMPRTKPQVALHRRLGQRWTCILVAYRIDYLELTIQLVRPLILGGGDP